MLLEIFFCILTLAKANSINDTITSTSNTNRLLNALQRHQEYQNISRTQALEFPFDIGRRKTHE